MTQMPDVPSTPDATSPHKPADDSEQIYYEGSPMLRGEVGKLIALWLIGLLFIAAPFLVHMARGEWLPWYVNLVLIVIGLIFMIIPSIMVRMVRYRISNYRIDYERGLLSRSIDTL